MTVCRGARPVRQTPTWCVMLDWTYNLILIIRDTPMSQQLLEAYALVAYADDLDDDTDDDVAWMEYLRTASTLCREDILAVVLDELNSPASPLYDLIDSALQSPHEPGHPRESVTVLASLGKAILNIVAKVVDDAVGLRMAVEVCDVRP